MLQGYTSFARARTASPQSSYQGSNPRIFPPRILPRIRASAEILPVPPQAYQSVFQSVYNEIAALQKAELAAEQKLRGPLRERAVGSLSRGELKRVTVGVELASNPSVLFLDEPTTGLDAREAAALVRVLRNVSETGRNVIATIHQPSAEVFFACTLDLPAHRPNHPPTHPSS